MMEDRAHVQITRGRLPRVKKVPRHRHHKSLKIQCHHPSTIDTRDVSAIPETIRPHIKTRPIDNKTVDDNDNLCSVSTILTTCSGQDGLEKLVVTPSLGKWPNSSTGNISVTRFSRQLSPSQSRRKIQDSDISSKISLQGQQQRQSDCAPRTENVNGNREHNNGKFSITKEYSFRTAKVAHYQDPITDDLIRVDDHSDVAMTHASSDGIDSVKAHRRRDLNEKTNGKYCCRRSRLCLILVPLAAVLIATAIAAILVGSLIKSKTTATTTTTTAATGPITYVPTGIYALTIATNATWNETGITVAGNSNGTSGSDLGSLFSPVDIFVDNNYTLYVSDRDNNRILKYYPNSPIGTLVAGDLIAGDNASQLNQPKGVAVDQMGDLIVADSSNYRIQRFPSGSTVATTEAINSSSNIIGQIRDLHIDVNNNFYVTDSDYSRIIKFYPNNGIGVVLAGNSGAGSAADQFFSPFGNFVDGNNTLYVADYGNQRVQAWVAEATSGVTVAGIDGSAGPALTQLSSPVAIIVDNNGYIYVADLGNSRIVKWTTNYATGGVCVVGCTGSAGTAPDQLNGPRDLKFDASGNLYVSDQGNNRVQKFQILP